MSDGGILGPVREQAAVLTPPVPRDGYHTTLDNKKNHPKIRGEKNAIPSCDIMLDHARSVQGKCRG